MFSSAQTTRWKSLYLIVVIQTKRAFLNGTDGEIVAKLASNLRWTFAYSRNDGVVYVSGSIPDN